MKKECTCCVTGHRDIPKGKISAVKAALRAEVLAAIADGYTHFISGFASGADLLFAEAVADLKAAYSITLEADIPYLSRMFTYDEEFGRRIKQCDKVEILTDYYYDGCLMARNRYMVDHSSRVIAVYDGRAGGGTAATLRYARESRCAIRMIRI